MAKHVMWRVQVILADDTTVHGEWLVKAPDTRGKVFQKKLAAAREAQGYKFPEPPAESSAWFIDGNGNRHCILWQAMFSPWSSYDMPGQDKNIPLYRVATTRVESEG